MIINSIDGEVSRDKVEVLENTLGYTVGKNLLEVTATTTTKNGITFTVNDDGSVTANGTATSLAAFVVARNLVLPNGEYILSGCAEGAAVGKHRLSMTGIGVAGDDYGQGHTFVINDGTIINTVTIYVPSGQTVDNLTFYPMIRKASITDDTYVPYKDDVDTRLNSKVDASALTSLLEWKKITVTGTTAIDLSQLNYNELKIETMFVDGSVYYSKGLTVNYSTDYYRKCDLSSTVQQITIYTEDSGSSSSDNHSVYNISENILQLYKSYRGSAYNSSNNSNTTTHLYYR